MRAQLSPTSCLTNITLLGFICPERKKKEVQRKKERNEPKQEKAILIHRLGRRFAVSFVELFPAASAKQLIPAAGCRFSSLHMSTFRQIKRQCFRNIHEILSRFFRIPALLRRVIFSSYCSRYFCSEKLLPFVTEFVRRLLNIHLKQYTSRK